MNKNPISGKAFQWNGEKLKDVKFGYVRQVRNERPMYWYNWEIKKQKDLGIVPGDFAIIPAVQITTLTGDVFCIANIAGQAIQKMEAGGMWHHSHMSVEKDFTEDDEFAIYEYNHLNLHVYNTGLEKWQKENFPEDFAKLEALKGAINRSQKEFKPGATIGLGDIMGAPKHGKASPTPGISGKTIYHGKNKKR